MVFSITAGLYESRFVNLKPASGFPLAPLGTTAQSNLAAIGGAIDQAMVKSQSEHVSWRMGRVKQRDTLPEIIVRKTVHGLGYRFRLHDRRLPGSPDLVFRSRRKVIFVHGCYWHSHPGCPKATVPKSNTQFWLEKFSTNRVRDERAVVALANLGWSALTVWQCELHALNDLKVRLKSFLG